jgi:PAS domain S-box-containing protein
MTKGCSMEPVDKNRINEMMKILMQAVRGDFTFPSQSKSDPGFASNALQEPFTSPLETNGEGASFEMDPAAAVLKIIRSVINPVIVLDIDKKISHANSAALDLLEYSETELIGKNYTSLFADSATPDKTSMAAMFDQVYVSNEAHELISKSGKQIPVFCSRALLVDITGKKQGVVCTIRNMSEQRRVEDLKCLLIEMSPDAIVTMDVEGNITSCNPATLHMLGCLKAELLGKHLAHLEFFQPEDISKFNRIFTNVLQGKFKQELFESELKKRDGSLIWVEIRLGQIVEGGKLVGLQVITRDITQRKQAEKEKDELEKQLHQSQKMEAIGQLAGGVAHDFNNILSGISLQLGMLDMKITGNSELRPYVEKILSMTQRAAGISKQLLNFARKSQFDFRDLDVHECILQSVEILQYSFDDRIVIKTDLVADVSTISGDFDKIASVFINLGLNARDAMPPGGELVFATETVLMETNAFQDEGERFNSGLYLKITVTDNGQGMDEETKGRIFEPFFTTKEFGQGTGLGLASVYGSIKQHHGLIRVESEKNQGTKFEIYLPAILPEVEGQEDEAALTGSGKRGTVLVVDDEESVREAMSEILTGLNYQVHVCDNYDSTIMYYRKHFKNIDLVILELEMSPESGLTCLKSMQRINENVRVIMSAEKSAEERLHILRQEGASVLLKPFKVKELSRAVTTILKLGKNDAQNTDRGRQ